MNASTTHHAGPFRRSLRQWPAALSSIPVLMIPLLEYFPWIPDSTRGPMIVFSVALAAVGFWVHGKRQKRFDVAESEVRRLQEIVEGTGPHQLLRQISESLFREGAWRLTIYRKQGASQEAYDLEMISSIASGGADESAPQGSLRVDRRSSLAGAFRNNLANPRYRQADQSGAFPDDVHSESWQKWRQGVLGDAHPPYQEALFRPRKYAWYAAQDPRSDIVYTALAESTSSQGIAIDFLDHNSTPAWLFYVGEIFDLKQSAQREASSEQEAQ